MTPQWFHQVLSVILAKKHAHFNAVVPIRCQCRLLLQAVFPTVLSCGGCLRERRLRFDLCKVHGSPIVRLFVVFVDHIDIATAVPRPVRAVKLAVLVLEICHFVLQTHYLVLKLAHVLKALLHSLIQLVMLILHLLDAPFVGDLAPILVVLRCHDLVPVVL